MKRASGLAAIGAILLAALSGCGGEAQPQRRAIALEQIAVDGSSTVFPLVEAAAESFSRNAAAAARVTVGESGTGGGFRKFCRGEIDIANASRPISADEMQACSEAGVAFVEIPIAFDGIALVVHPTNPVDEMSMTQLREIWRPSAERTVVNWNQVDPAWPNLALQLFGPGTASGTFDFFTEAVMGESGASRTDFTPSEDDNVIVQGVAGNPGALGYFGYAYFEQNRRRLKGLRLDGVAPSPETIASGAYPLSRPMFVYVNAESLRRPQVRRFVEYLLAHAASLAPQVGYVPLPQEAYRTYLGRVRERAAGTAFAGGSAVGLSIEELIERPLAAPNL